MIWKIASAKGESAKENGNFIINHWQIGHIRNGYSRFLPRIWKLKIYYGLSRFREGKPHFLD